MPADASIYSLANRPTTQLESPFDLYSKGAQIQGMRQSLEQNKMAIDAQKKAVADNATLAGLARDANGDVPTMIDLARKNGLTTHADAIEKNWITTQKALSELDDTKRKYVQAQNEDLGKAAAWADTPEKWLVAAREHPQLGSDFSQREKFIFQASTLQQALERLKPAPTPQPLSSVGKLAADLKAGLIGTPEYKAALAKETHVAPSATMIVGGNNGLTPEALDMMADQFRKTGTLPSTGMGSSGTALRMQLINRAAEMDKAEGVKTDLAESKRSFKSSQDAREYFTKGKGADAFRQQETILHHADAFSQISDALNNGDIQGANKIGNALGVQFGSDQATNYRIVAQILSAEVGKYLAGSQSTAEERKELSDLIPAFSSPRQIKGGLATLKALVEGQRKSWVIQRDAALKGQVPTYSSETAKPKGGAKTPDELMKALGF